MTISYFALSLPYPSLPLMTLSYLTFHDLILLCLILASHDYSILRFMTSFCIAFHYILLCISWPFICFALTRLAFTLSQLFYIYFLIWCTYLIPSIGETKHHILSHVYFSSPPFVFFTFLSRYLSPTLPAQLSGWLISMFLYFFFSEFIWLLCQAETNSVSFLYFIACTFTFPIIFRHYLWRVISPFLWAFNSDVCWFLYFPFRLWNSLDSPILFCYLKRFYLLMPLSFHRCVLCL